MNPIVPKRSPLHSWHASRCNHWCQVGEVSLPHHFADLQVERNAVSELALCDLSGVPWCEFKGPGAASWLASRNLPVPEKLYQGEETATHSWITRTGSDEFLLRGVLGSTFSELTEEPIEEGYQHEVLIRGRHDSLFLLTGHRTGELLAQTCGLDYQSLRPAQTVFTRVAGVNCGLITDQQEDGPRCWLWLDPSQAFYLWRELVAIIEDLSGSVVGIACFYSKAD